MKKNLLILCIVLLCSCLLSVEDTAYNGIVINEFMTNNTSGVILDEKGQAEDWIEIYNKSNDQINVKGLFLSDDSTELTAFAFPDTVIPAHGFLLVWADDDIKQGLLHAPFKLSSQDGDEIILSYENKVIDRIQFFPHNNNPQARLPDVSYGRSSDGDTSWTRQSVATPAASNKGK